MEIIVKDILSDIETRRAIQKSNLAAEVVEALDNNNGKNLKYFVIDRFPSEFKKNILKSLDLRFFSILIFSLIFHILTILFLEKKFPVHIDSKMITKIQQRYVDLLLDRNVPLTVSYEITDSPASTETLDPEALARMNQWLDAFAGNASESMSGFNSGVSDLLGASMQETRVPTKDMMGEAHRSAAMARSRTLSELEKEVSSIGLLGLIGSNTRMRDHEYIEDLLSYAELNADNLSSVLSGLSSIQVPRHNTAGYILSYKSNADIRGGKLKGGRSQAENENIDAIRNIAPLEKVETAPTKRTIEYESIPTEDKLVNLQSQSIVGKKREPQEVIRVVQSHKRALQDCYKQELKNNPAVQGRIVVRFTIDPNGNVESASVVSSTLNSPRMENCIINRIQNWKDFGPCDPAFGSATFKQVFNFGGD